MVAVQDSRQAQDSGQAWTGRRGALPTWAGQGRAGQILPGGPDGVLGLALALITAAGLLVACADRTLPVAGAPLPRIVPASPPVPSAEIPRSPVPRAKPTPPGAAPPVGADPVGDGRARADPTRADPTRAGPGPADLPPVAETLPGPVEGPGRHTAPAVDPAVLVGMTEGETLILLGHPGRVEETPPAKIWHYANDRCVLRVHLFMEMSSRDFRTLTYELTSMDQQPDVDQQCLADLVAQAARDGDGNDDPRPDRPGG